MVPRPKTMSNMKTKMELHHLQLWGDVLDKLCEPLVPFLQSGETRLDFSFLVRLMWIENSKYIFKELLLILKYLIESN